MPNALNLRNLMKRTILLACCVGVLVFATDAAELKSTSSTNITAGVTNNPSPDAGVSQETLEARLKTSLSGTTFVGRWCLIADDKLGAEKEETYTINSVTKLGGTIWLINARVQYANRDLNVPIPVAIKWAGDTPVITLTDLTIPGLGTYTARVVIYGKTYAGTWSGGEHRGLLQGLIKKNEETKSAEAK